VVQHFAICDLRFADDAAMVAHDVKSVQTLLDVCVAWFTWGDMKLRIDKCRTFAVWYTAKHSGKFAQFFSSLFVLGTARYMLCEISKLSVRPQMKLCIIRQSIPPQVSFQLKQYDISLIWISENLDDKITKCVRDCLKLPIILAPV